MLLRPPHANGEAEKKVGKVLAGRPLDLCCTTLAFCPCDASDAFWCWIKRSWHWISISRGQERGHAHSSKSRCLSVGWWGHEYTVLFSRPANMTFNDQSSRLSDVDYSFFLISTCTLLPSKELQHWHFWKIFNGTDLVRSRYNAFLLVFPENLNKSLENTQQVGNQRVLRFPSDIFRPVLDWRLCSMTIPRALPPCIMSHRRAGTGCLPLP